MISRLFSRVGGAHRALLLSALRKNTRFAGLEVLNGRGMVARRIRDGSVTSGVNTNCALQMRYKSLNCDLLRYEFRAPGLI
jgi:hypothetical protein